MKYSTTNTTMLVSFLLYSLVCMAIPVGILLVCLKYVGCI